MTRPSVALPPDAVEIIRRQIVCTCDAHYTQGDSARCRDWRLRTAEDVVGALLAANGPSPVTEEQP